MYNHYKEHLSFKYVPIAWRKVMAIFNPKADAINPPSITIQFINIKKYKQTPENIDALFSEEILEQF